MSLHLWNCCEDKQLRSTLLNDSDVPLQFPAKSLSFKPAKRRLLGNYGKISFTLHTGSWALQAEKLHSRVLNNILSCIEGKIQNKFSVGLQSGQASHVATEWGSFPWAWPCGPSCSSGFSWQHMLDKAVTCLVGPLRTPSSDSNCF